MANYTFAKEFYILPFSYKVDNKPLIFSAFALIYLIGLLMNIIIVTVIYIDDQLHTPMYRFLCNLSIVDMCYTTTIVPKLLNILLSGNNTVSFKQCFTQMYFFFLAAGTEDLLLFTMAYDRYVAICNPLHYHSIMSKKVCFLFMVAIWLCSCLNSLLITIPVSNMSFCHSNTIQHFYCDAKALTKISCSGKDLFFFVIYLELLLFGLFPFLCSVTSYTQILKVIFHIKSGYGRRKAFSTCSSHLTVIILYYGTAASVYLIPPSEYSDVLDQVFTFLYATATPMLNPLIYSVRNKDVKQALLRLLGLKLHIQD